MFPKQNEGTGRQPVPFSVRFASVHFVLFKLLSLSTMLRHTPQSDEYTRLPSGKSAPLLPPARGRYLCRPALQSVCISPTPSSSLSRVPARTEVPLSVRDSSQYNKMGWRRYGSVSAILLLFHRMGCLPGADK